MLVPMDVVAVWRYTHTASGVLVLGEIGGPRVLHIAVGDFEAVASVDALEGRRPPRPQTHDLLLSILGALDVRVIRVVVQAIREGTFYAEIDLRAADGSRTVDARPSDAIALALRARAPLFCREEVLIAAGITPGGGGTPSEECDRVREWLEDVRPEDFGTHRAG